MPTAALYDIHGNLAALDAVLAEVPDDAQIVVGGDIVAGGAEASETIERLRALGSRVHWLRGNADRELYPGETGFAPPDAIEETRAQLTGEQLEFLYRLPPSVQLGDVLYVHASPRNDEDIFTESTPAERIAFLFEDVDADVVVCGHTHMQFDRVIGGKRVVNAGSVGMSYDAQPGAYWLLDLEHRFTHYDGATEPEQSRDAVLAFFTERGL